MCFVTNKQQLRVQRKGSKEPLFLQPITSTTLKNKKPFRPDKIKLVQNEQ